MLNWLGWLTMRIMLMMHRFGKLWCKWRGMHHFKHRKSGYYQCCCGLYLWSRGAETEWQISGGDSDNKWRPCND